MKYARSENNIVVQVIGNDPAKLFMPEVVVMFRPCDADVQAGWLDDGTTYAAPPIMPPTIPAFVTMRQARLALDAAGLLDTVSATIAAMTGQAGKSARIEWEFSSEVKRNQPLVLALGPTLGLTSIQLDSLFTAAAGL